jgi:hypothetical protein
LDLGAVAACVLEEHREIRRLLDDVEEAAGATRSRQRGFDCLHRAVWMLYVAFEEHLLFEERELGPLLAALLPAGVVMARRMVLEHTEQRDALLRLVEDSESDAREAKALADEALETVIRFRVDMVLEERSLLAVVPSAPLRIEAD